MSTYMYVMKLSFIVERINILSFSCAVKPLALHEHFMMAAESQYQNSLNASAC